MSQQMFSTAYWCCVISIMNVCASALFCDITSQLPEKDNNPGFTGDFSYLALEINKTCFLFVMRQMTLVEAARSCRRWGARLTSVDSFVDNNIQIGIKEEKNMSLNVLQNYWVGLIWNKYIDSWLWENGDDLTATVPVSPPCWGCFWDAPACVTMNSAQFKSRYCNEKFPFICKLTLDDDADQNIVGDDGKYCGRCTDYLKFHQRTYVVPTMLPSLDNSTLPSPEFDSATSTRPTPSNDSKDSQGLKTDGNMRLNHPNINVVVYLLAGLVLVLLLAVVGLLVEVIRTRRRLRRSQTSNKISLVDILMVDDTGYSQPDGRLPDADNEQLDNDNPRNSRLRKDGSSENLYTNTDDNLSQAAPLGRTLDNQAMPFDSYAHLHQGGDTQAQNIYGMESASVQAPRSPTYESFN